MIYGSTLLSSPVLGSFALVESSDTSDSLDPSGSSGSSASPESIDSLGSTDSLGSPDSPVSVGSLSLPIMSSLKSLIFRAFLLISYLKNKAKSDEQSWYHVQNS